MKKRKELWSPFLTIEKGLLIIGIFVLILISIAIVYKNSIYSYDNYNQVYPNAGLEFFYYLYCIGVNPFLFILLMLLIPNLTAYDFLNIHQNHAAYMIETRISKKQYYHNIFIKNIVFTGLIIFVIQIGILVTIHFFYAPITFNSMTYPQDYYSLTQIFCQNEMINLILFIASTSIGYAIVSSLIFSFQMIITNKYIYRCFGVIFGILLVLIPALIQGYLPIPDLAFLLQINNVVAIGMENVRANPFGLTNLFLYLISSCIYLLISLGCFQALQKWREKYD